LAQKDAPPKEDIHRLPTCAGNSKNNPRRTHPSSAGDIHNTLRRHHGHHPTEEASPAKDIQLLPACAGSIRHPWPMRPSPPVKNNPSPPKRGRQHPSRPTEQHLPGNIRCHPTCAGNSRHSSVNAHFVSRRHLREPAEAGKSKHHSDSEASSSQSSTPADNALPANRGKVRNNSSGSWCIIH
jgi:hypothetical protein